MHRIDTTSRAQGLFGSGKDGFTKGDSTTGVEATEVSADILNAIQEEIANVIERSGATLIKGNREQLYSAMVSLAGADIAARNLTDGEIGWADTRYTAAGVFDSNGIACALAGANGKERYWDGTSWSEVSAAGAYTGTFYGSVYNPDTLLYIAAGTNGEIQTSTGVGTVLTARTAAGGYTGTFYSAAYDGAGLYCLVGTNGEIQTSPDGITWTARTAAGAYTGTFYGVVFANSMWMILGSTGQIQTSPDGVTWTAKTPTSGDAITAAYSTGDNVWFVRTTVGGVYSTDDGATWVASTGIVGNTNTGTRVFYSATFNRFVSVNSGYVNISTDAGKTFTASKHDKNIEVFGSWVLGDWLVLTGRNASSSSGGRVHYTFRGAI